MTKNANRHFDPETPVWGAYNIALAAGLVDKKGRARVRATYHLLETGRLPASKVGNTWVSTPARLRAIANGVAAP